MIPSKHDNAASWHSVLCSREVARMSVEMRQRGRDSAPASDWANGLGIGVQGLGLGLGCSPLLLTVRTRDHDRGGT